MIDKTGAIVFCIAVLTALFIGILAINSPASKNHEDRFSAERAFKHVEVIAQKQHSVFDLNEIEEVRSYIGKTLDAFENVKWTKVKHNPHEAFNAKTQTRKTIEIENFYAEISGTSGRYMLISAHYDACPFNRKYNEASEGSYGAADDGYGVACILEIMRLLNDYAKENKLVNGVKFVITDAEEVGLIGAKRLVKEYAFWIADVNIVINLEARGNKGPLYMFQTSDNNYQLIDFYRRTNKPFSFSVAAEVYKYLPNNTDFTPFLEEGFAGLNFSTLNSLKNYHTPNDNLKNADKPTLQFYGEQIYPLVKEYINKERYSAPDYFTSDDDAVFFTFLPGVLIFYSHTLSWIFIAIAIVCMFLIAYIAKKKQAISLLKILLAMAVWIAYLIFAAVAGLLLAKMTGLLTGNKFNLMYMPYVPFDTELMVIFAVLVLAIGFFAVKLCKKLKCRLPETLGGAIWLLLIFASLFAFKLHGGTYLFVWPAIFMMCMLVINLFFPTIRNWWKHTIQAFTILISSILYITLIYSLFLALTFGALAIVLLFTALLGCVLAPCGMSNSQSVQKT